MGWLINERVFFSILRDCFRSLGNVSSSILAEFYKAYSLGSSYLILHHIPVFFDYIIGEIASSSGLFFLGSPRGFFYCNTELFFLRVLVDLAISAGSFDDRCWGHYCEHLSNGLICFGAIKN